MNSKLFLHTGKISRQGICLYNTICANNECTITWVHIGHYVRLMRTFVSPRTLANGGQREWRYTEFPSTNIIVNSVHRLSQALSEGGAVFGGGKALYRGLTIYLDQYNCSVLS